jgi:DeoR family transcriptional regulator, catabolite repression regulator
MIGQKREYDESASTLNSELREPMALNDKKLAILQAIAAGSTTGPMISSSVGSSTQLLNYYLDTMAQDDYIQVAKLFDNASQEFQVVRAYLTDKGQTSLAEHLSRLAPAAATVAATEAVTVAVAPPAPPMAGAREGDEEFVPISVTFAPLQASIDALPTEWQELADVYLDDLKAEINIPYRRRPVRIKAYFLALLRLLVPLLKQLPDGAQLGTQLDELSQQLNIPIKLP